MTDFSKERKNRKMFFKQALSECSEDEPMSFFNLMVQTKAYYELLSVQRSDDRLDHVV